ncbi:MAG: hypothetical protein AB7C89_02675 [Intestinibacillus sp.]
MKTNLKPSEVLKRYRSVERRQSIVSVLFVLMVAAVLLMSRFGVEHSVAVTLLVLALLSLGWSYYIIRRCPVCGMLLLSWPPHFSLPLECPCCHTNFATGLTPELTLRQLPNA